jgi:Family of unknown function (DUF6459)
MTTSAPQWPGQEGMPERSQEQDPVSRPEPTSRRPAPAIGDSPPDDAREADCGLSGAAKAQSPPNDPPALRAGGGDPARRLQSVPVENWTPDHVGSARDLSPAGDLGSTGGLDAFGGLDSTAELGPTAEPKATAEPSPTRELSLNREVGPTRELRPTSPTKEVGPTGVPGLAGGPNSGPASVVDLLERRRLQQRLRRAAARSSRFVVVRDATEPDLWAARRRARAILPSPVAVTRDIALALLEVEAGCRSAGQLERVFSRPLWEALEHRIGRRGGPLPSGRSLISVRCQEDRPGLADTVAVVRRGELVRPVALRLDACGGRWIVTELRWWRNETDTAVSPSRDGGSSR